MNARELRLAALNAAAVIYVGRYPTNAPNADAIVGYARTFETYLRGVDDEPDDETENAHAALVDYLSGLPSHFDEQAAHISAHNLPDVRDDPLGNSYARGQIAAFGEAARTIRRRLVSE